VALLAIQIVASRWAPPETAMNCDKIEGGWRQFKGKAREQWGRLMLEVSRP